MTSAGLSNSLIQEPTKNYVKVCDNLCEVDSTTSTDSKAYCKLPKMSTIYSDQNLKIEEENIDLKAEKFFGSLGSSKNYALAFDDDLTEPLSVNTNACHIGASFKENHIGLISQVRYFFYNLPSNKALVANKLKFQGSMDGTKYTDIFTVGDNVMEGWNYYTWDNLVDYQQYRYYRFKGETSYACRMTEIKFRGVETVANNAEDYSCPVDIYIDKVK